jgi:hypothetical protein
VSRRTSILTRYRDEIKRNTIRKDPQAAGIYTFTLSGSIADSTADSGRRTLASTSIDVIISAVPLPATLPFLVMGLSLLGFKSRRAKTTV